MEKKVVEVNRCSKCGSIMFFEKNYGNNMFDSYWAFRCPICGNCEDSTILVNREISKPFISC